MTPETLQGLIAGGETLSVEFKGEERSPLNDRDLVEAVVCLANHTGAEPSWLLIGVEDDGRITRREAAGLCRISGPRAYRLLNRLAEQGFLDREGERGRGVGYRRSSR